MLRIAMSSRRGSFVGRWLLYPIVKRRLEMKWVLPCSFAGNVRWPHKFTRCSPWHLALVVMVLHYRRSHSTPTADRGNPSKCITYEISVLFVSPQSISQRSNARKCFSYPYYNQPLLTSWAKILILSFLGLRLVISINMATYGVTIS